MIEFFAQGITILSAVFALGGVSYLYIRYKTRVLKFVLLFLLSLFLISTAFWFNAFPGGRLFPSGSSGDFIYWIFQLLGSGLNIIVLPYLISDLVSIPLKRWIKGILWGWNTIFIVLGITYIIIPGLTVVERIITGMVIATILGALIFCAVGLPNIKNRWWKQALVWFFIISAVYLGLLVADILISLLPIPALAPVDNLSLPVYLIVLNAGIFYFAGKFLSRDPLVKNGKLTESCLQFYGLTPREAALIEELMLGSTNKEIAEKLFISVKTVENHLYNIYQKIDVTSRLQLLHALNTWGSE